MAGLEPARPFGLRIFLPATTFVAHEKVFSSSQFGVWTMPSSYAKALAKALRWEPSRLYTLPKVNLGLSSALPFSSTKFRF